MKHTETVYIMKFQFLWVRAMDHSISHSLARVQCMREICVLERTVNNMKYFLEY